LFKALFKTLEDERENGFQKLELSAYCVLSGYRELLDKKSDTIDEVKEQGQAMINFALGLKNLKEPLRVLDDNLGELLLSIDDKNRLTVKKITPTIHL